MNNVMKALLPFAFAIVMLFAVVTISDSVYANDATTAEKIGLNSEKTYTFTDYEYEYYYKFVPPSTGYYAVNVYNFVKDATYITVTDAIGDYVAFNGWDQYTNKVRLACKLKKGKTYYICVECFVDEGDGDLADFDDMSTVSAEKIVRTKITKHSHSYKTVIKYTGGIDQQCTFPECYYERMKITAKPAIKKLKKGKKSFKVTWKCNTDCNNGYQIQYSTSKKFKNAKSVKVGWNATSKKVKKLKKRKNYYVRVRAYAKMYQMDGTTTTHYGPWSKAKKVKTR